MLRLLSGIFLAASLVGCGGDSVKQAWSSAGARPGWCGPDASGFSEGDRSPGVTAIPGFWGHREFDFEQLGTLPVPQRPFGLHFGGSTLTESQLQQLHRFRGAEALGLNASGITDDDLRHLVTFKDLKILDLGNTHIGDEGLESVGKLRKLETLILLSTRVSDAGADTLGKMKALEVLDISDTEITDEGLKKIARLPALRYLGVSGTRVTNAGISDVKQHHPGIEIDARQRELPPSR